MKPAAASNAKGAKPRSSAIGLWLGSLAGLMAAVLAPTSSAIAAVLLLPTALTWIADTQPGRPTARVVLLFGLAAACAPFDALWHAGTGLISSHTITLAVDLRTLALAWAAQAGGWLLTQLLPLLIERFADAQTRKTIKLLDARKAQLQQEWDQNT